MKITLSLSEAAKTQFDPNAKGQGMGYMGSRFLAEAFVKRGHDLNIVHPNDICYDKLGRLYTRSAYEFVKGRFYKKRTDAILSGDVFFVYSLDEEQGASASKRFIDVLFQMEKQFPLVLNSAESTSYEYKPKQKTLELPWIPGFDIKSPKELSDLVASGERIIAKPRIGACGMGVEFLEHLDDLQRIGDIDEYLFERYVQANEERRYIFLDNQCIIRRKMSKKGLPGRERCTNVDLMEGIPREIEIARRVIAETGMFYGAVDFRGEYVLEINGSGTGVAPPTARNETDSYNLSDSIVQAVERKISS